MFIFFFRYFTQLYLALVILPSPECIVALGGTVCHDIYHSMTAFFKDQQLFDAVLKWEKDHDFFWSTLLPLISALYIPNAPKTTSSDGKVATQTDEQCHVIGPGVRETDEQCHVIGPGVHVLEKLQLLSIETILFGLRVMLSRENQRKILVKEGLLDYVRCLPTYIPVSLRPQAKMVVDIMISSLTEKETLFSPPSLLATVKAHIAKNVCGLDKVLELSVGQLCSELLV